MQRTRNQGKKKHLIQKEVLNDTRILLLHAVLGYEEFFSPASLFFLIRDNFQEEV